MNMYPLTNILPEQAISFFEPDGSIELDVLGGDWEELVFQRSLQAYLEKTTTENETTRNYSRWKRSRVTR